MKKALISPDEPRTDKKGNRGFRVAHVVSLTYDVAPPLFWVDCPDECVKDFWIYVGDELVDITPDLPEDVPVEPLPVIDNYIEL
jgi:hypothetical protein